MDIENMHPFCLPFGLCHDATSASMTADLVASANQNNSSSTVAPTTAGATASRDLSSSASSSPSPLSPSSKESRLSNLRSKNSSPSDELFRQLNQNHVSSNTILGQSLLSHHDLIIGHSASFDVIADESFYSSLGIIDDDVDGLHNGDGDEENRLRKSSITTDIEFTDSDQKLDEEEEEPIDWYCNEYSLFSPTRRKSLSSAAAIRATNLLHHQVFQHLVDPIELKSSPTLAQLNLNSNDNDPIDGFWDSTTSSSSSSANHHHSSSSAPTNTDLLSNCTSINKNSLTAGTCCSRTLSNHHHNHHLHHHQHHNHSGVGSDSVVCNHLNHHSQDQHHHTQHHLSSSSYSAAHLGHQANQQQQQLSSYQQQQQQQQTCRCHATLQGSSCLAVASFRGEKPALQQQHHQPACSSSAQNLASTHLNCTSLNDSNTNNNTLNLKPTTALNELSNQQLASVGHQQQNHGSPTCEHDPKKRPSSPALVTSSSSPLSSSLASAPGQQQPALQTPADFAPGEGVENNKLKENIEYLTALLCNGNKLNENNNYHSSSISSSMARSYTTLAHTLSTGPKLLERPLQQQQQPDLASISSYAHAIGLNNNIIVPNRHPTNEAASCMDPSGVSKKPRQVHHHHHMQQPHDQPQQQWIKVESSISAADSTESQITMPYTIRSGHACSTNSGCLNLQCLHHHNQTESSDDPSKHLSQPQQPLRVLSSLLSGDSISTKGCSNHLSMSPSLCPRWAPASQSAPHQMQQAGLQPQMNSTTSADPPTTEALHQQQQQQASVIPPNGRPITLTPITSHNNPIHLQQQQQQQQQAQLAAKLKSSSPFIQPASPSASSTASSAGTSAELGPSGFAQATKKPRLSSTTRVKSPATHTKSATGSRPARPNSMSTECSLSSSHDEGFASQMDNDDCGNSNRGDSDDDADDVDSDDESFYGDYTNSDLIGASISDDAENKWTLNMGRTRRNGQKRFFWQYNVQSKGPKGTRICSTDDSEDPFVLPEASDPVFSNDCQVEGVKHSGKARRGDGNDLTPNPRKLLMIGLELKKLGKIINELAPVTDLPINARTKTRKEKNKLASRACRLKKKAQHEANKIKLYGLQREHQQVVMAIYDVRKLLNQVLSQKDNASKEAAAVGEGHSQAQKQSSANEQQPSPPKTTTADGASNSSQSTSGTVTAAPLSAASANGECFNARAFQVESTNASVFSIAEQCSMRVAGQTSDFVNSVLEKVVSGFIDGGLET